MRKLIIGLGLGLAIGLVGCGEEEFCPDGIVTDTPIPGLEKVGDNGWTIEFASIDVPNPPDEGVNRWEFEIRDDLGDVRTDVDVRVEPTFTEDDFSPDPFPATVEEDLHIVPDIDLDRPGVWDFDIVVDDDAGVELDRADFKFCLDGE